jgi:hypothetical protein
MPASNTTTATSSTLRNLVIGLVASAAIWTAPATATTVTLDALGPGRNVAMVVDNVASTEGAYQLKITLDGQARIAYCVDYFTLIDYAMYTSALATPDTIANGNRMAWIFVQYGATTTSADVAAAVQIAIWDLAHDNGDGINAGRIRLASNASSNVRSLSQSYLTASVNKSSTNATILFNTDPVSGLPAQLCPVQRGRRIHAGAILGNPADFGRADSGHLKTAWLEAIAGCAGGNA